MEEIKDEEALWDISIKEELVGNVEDISIKEDESDWNATNEEEIAITEIGDDFRDGEIELSLDIVDFNEPSVVLERSRRSHPYIVKTMEKQTKRNLKKITLDDILPPPRKHKKHKHKKHKKKRSDSEGSQGEGAIALNKSIAAPAVPAANSPQRVNEVKIQQTGVSPPKSTSKKKKGKGGRDSGTSSDEERWLDAIESGKLEEVDDELKKIKTKDPKLMTARQRAMLERKGDAVPDPCAEQLLSLPTGYREKVMTPEMIKKAALKSQKRKQLQDEKREKDKKRTMERLLRKQDNKAAKQIVKKNMKKVGAIIAYCNNTTGISLSLPPGIEYPLQKQIARPLPDPSRCGVIGCNNIKKYSCSKTHVPLCSLGCYKRNLSTFNITVN